MMKQYLTALAVVAAGCLAGVTQAAAGDLPPEPIYPDAPYDSTYEPQGGYAYGSVVVGQRPYCPHRRQSGYSSSYGYGYNGPGPDYSAGPAYSDEDPNDEGDGPYANAPTRCLQSREVQETLVRQGWRGFRNPERGVDVVGLTASRPNGLTYRLKLDRCTGVIISAHLLDQNDPYGGRHHVYSSSYSYYTPVPGY